VAGRENSNEYALVIAGQLNNRNLSRNERRQLQNQAFSAQYCPPSMNWVKVQSINSTLYPTNMNWVKVQSINSTLYPTNMNWVKVLYTIYTMHCTHYAL
jgi:hypothetical protein